MLVIVATMDDPMRRSCLDACRYEKLENKVLAESTVAGQNASVQYLAACAALQQWEQSALAYLLLHTAPGPLSVDRLSAAVESLLEDNFSVSFLNCFTCLNSMMAVFDPCMSWVKYDLSFAAIVSAERQAQST